MKHILVPTDFSTCASNALEYACNIAQHFGAKITLMHVYPIPVAATDVPTELIIANQFKEEADVNIAKLKTRINQSHPEIHVQTMINAGDAPTEIDFYLKENTCDLVVMGTTGAGGFKRIAIGTTTAKVINHIQIPLMVIPENRPYSDIRHIVVSTSFERNEINHIKHIYEWYKEFNCKITLLRVDDITTYQDDKSSSQVTEFLKHLKDAMHQLEPDTVVIKGVDVSSSIIEYTKSAQVDLLVTVHQHRGFFSQLIFPSITKEIAFHPPVPMLIFNRHN